MSDIQRICANCGQSAPLAHRFCPACGADSQGDYAQGNYAQGNYALTEQRSLPATIGKAALPVLAGAATLALRVGWRLLNERLTAPAHSPARRESPVESRADVIDASTPSRRIRIRSAWAVGDGRGNVQHGSSEHIIDFD